RAAPRRETDEARRERARAAVTREGREYPIGDTLRVGEPALLERGLAAADELVRDLQQTLVCGRVARVRLQNGAVQRPRAVLLGLDQHAGLERELRHSQRIVERGPELRARACGLRRRGRCRGRPRGRLGRRQRVDARRPRLAQREPGAAEDRDERAADPEQQVALLRRALSLALRDGRAHQETHSRFMLRSFASTPSTMPVSGATSTSWRFTSAGFCSRVRWCCSAACRLTAQRPGESGLRRKRKICPWLISQTMSSTSRCSETAIVTSSGRCSFNRAVIDWMVALSVDTSVTSTPGRCSAKVFTTWTMLVAR